MHFGYHKKSTEDVKIAKNFSQLSTFSGSEEGLLARYFLAKYIRDTYGFIPNLQNEANGAPIPFFAPDGILYYWSISHTKNFIAYMTSNSPCGIDISEYEVRNSSLLNTHKEQEYILLGEKNWYNFYVLWTAKEAIIKKIGSTLDEMDQIRLISHEKDTYNFVFYEKVVTIHVIFKKNLFISYTL